MDLNNEISLGLTLLGQALSLITSLKNKAGLSDDALLAQAKANTDTNDATYNALVAHLATPAA